MKKVVYTGMIAVTLSACGGGGGSTDTGANTTAPVDPVVTTPPAIVAASSVAQQCAAPRSSSSDRQGSLTTEKSWIRAYVNETYLWYGDVAYVDPSKYIAGATVNYVAPSDNSTSSLTLASNYDVVDAYFNSQRSTLLTSSGKPKDQYHFTYTTAEWEALSNSGSSVGFGFQLALLSNRPPRSAVVAYSDPGTPAVANNIGRGAQILQVNGVNVLDGSPDVLNEGLFSPITGKQYTFTLQDQGSASTRTVTMTAGAVISTPVQNVHTLPAPYSDVGYLQFNDHIATAESQLIAAVNQLKAANSGAGIRDLVIDLRYNGGGLLDIASELAYMIAGATPTSGKTFEKLSFNDKNPFQVSASDASTPFHSTTKGFSTVSGRSLPQLGLSRVYVLVGSGTCSASESVINGLRGVGIEVVLIGNTTCGKPYGFYPTDNCSTTYFTIQFKGVNQAGFGEYADGFVPGGTGSTANNLPGCTVADDFSRPLGDISEARLATALRYRASGSCGVSATVARSAMAKMGSSEDVVLGRSAMRENRFYQVKTGAR